MPLDPEIEAHLQREAGSGLPPRSLRTLEQTRELYRRAAALSGAGPKIAAVDDLALPSAGRTIPTRLFRPALTGGLPLIVYFHGGRFISGDFVTHDPVCRQLAAAAGAVVALVDYRLAPEHPFPAAAEDASDAADWLLGHATELGCDPRRTALAGDSAGGNLAAVCALRLRDRQHPAPACAVLVYPMLDATCSRASHQTCGSGYGAGSADMKAGYDLYLPAGRDPRAPDISPLFAASVGGLPPTFILTAEYDSLRDEAEEFAARLGEAGVEVRLKRYEGAIHGFFQLGGVVELGRRAMADVAGFLKEQWQVTSG